MSAMKKVFLFSPKGIAEPYCSIQKPDYGNPEKGFGNPRGEYKVNLTVPMELAGPLMDKIDAAHKANYTALLAAHKKNPPVVQRGKKPLDPYEGEMPYFDNGDGTVTFKFKGYASFIDKKTQESKPIVLKVVDAQGKRIDNVPAISGGSELKVRFSLFPYSWSQVAGASVKLQIDSVMLLKLVEFGGGDDEWAEQAEEGGYVESESQRDWSQEDQGDYAEDEQGDNGQGDF